MYKLKNLKFQNFIFALVIFYCSVKMFLQVVKKKEKVKKNLFGKYAMKGDLKKRKTFEKFDFLFSFLLNTYSLMYFCFLNGYFVLIFLIFQAI